MQKTGEKKVWRKGGSVLTPPPARSSGGWISFPPCKCNAIQMQTQPPLDTPPKALHKQCNDPQEWAPLGKGVKQHAKQNLSN